MSLSVLRSGSTVGKVMMSDPSEKFSASRNLKRRVKAAALASLPRRFDPKNDEVVGLYVDYVMRAILRGRINEFVFGHPMDDGQRAAICRTARLRGLSVEAAGGHDACSLRVQIPPGSKLAALFAFKHDQSRSQLLLSVKDDQDLTHLTCMASRMGLVCFPAARMDPDCFVTQVVVCKNLDVCAIDEESWSPRPSIMSSRKESWQVHQTSRLELQPTTASSSGEEGASPLEKMIRPSRRPSVASRGGVARWRCNFARLILRLCHISPEAVGAIESV